jgi:hypothetical protein
VGVTIINTEGMSFIGPGSEWFWTAVSGIVLAVTFIAIYRQLRLQTSASAIQQIGSYDREWTSERMTHFKLEVLGALHDPAGPSAVPIGAATTLANFWEKIATLTRAGHIDRKLLWDGNGNDVRLWWVSLKPWVEAERTELSDPTLLEHFEWLAGMMAAMDERAGNPTLSEDWIKKSLDGRIVATRDRLRVEQSLRTVIIAPPETVPAVRGTGKP